MTYFTYFYASINSHWIQWYMNKAPFCFTFVAFFAWFLGVLCGYLAIRLCGTLIYIYARIFYGCLCCMHRAFKSRSSKNNHWIQSMSIIMTGSLAVNFTILFVSLSWLKKQTIVIDLKGHISFGDMEKCAWNIKAVLFFLLRLQRLWFSYTIIDPCYILFPWWWNLASDIENNIVAGINRDYHIKR